MFESMLEREQIETQMNLIRETSWDEEDFEDDDLDDEEDENL